jgi:hypothetical protein
MKRPASPKGEAGRVAATLQKMGIGGCGLDAPPMGEDEPMLVARALLIILYIIARFGKKWKGGGSERRGRWPQGRAPVPTRTRGPTQHQQESLANGDPKTGARSQPTLSFQDGPHGADESRLLLSRYLRPRYAELVTCDRLKDSDRRRLARTGLSRSQSTEADT